ncbi:MAG TPA: MFS transporter [Edaphobacter sp.]|nr:MFS transporter [Edaphobacter sp.]
MDSQPAPITNGGETAVDLRSRFRAAFFSVAPAMFLGSIDQTIVAAALPVIARSFGGLALTTWVVTGYLLAATVAAPIYGRLGDAFGRRRMLLCALGLFLVGSFICAMASSLMPSLKAAALFRGHNLADKFGAVFALASVVGADVEPDRKDVLHLDDRGSDSERERDQTELRA